MDLSQILYELKLCTLHPKLATLYILLERKSMFLERHLLKFKDRIHTADFFREIYQNNTKKY